MGFDINKYGSIAALSLLIVLILFTNLRHCFSAHVSGSTKLKTYEGEGCAKLQYMSIDSEEHHCPGEGTYAIAGQCLEYLECVKSTAENSSTPYLDYFQICDETQHFNGTGCSTVTAGGNGDCLQKHCRIVEVDMGGNDSENVTSEVPGAEAFTTVSILIDEAVETKTEANSNSNFPNGNSSSVNHAHPSSSSLQLSAGVKSHGAILLFLSLMLSLSAASY